VNLAYFLLLQVGFGNNAFTTDMVHHRGQPGYGRIADARIAERVGPLPPRLGGIAMERWVQTWTEEQQELRRRFNDATPRYANALVILMIPFFALGVRLLRLRGRFVRDLVFSLHFFSFLMIFSLVLPVPFILLYWIWPAAGVVLQSEAQIGLMLAAAVVAYCAFAFRTAYDDSWTAAVARGLTGPVLLLGVLTIYRMILFFIVFHSV
jgi:hypothetical protein